MEEYNRTSYSQLMVRAYISITNMIIKDMNYNNRNVYQKGKEKRRKEIKECVDAARDGFYFFKLL